MLFVNCLHFVWSSLGPSTLMQIAWYHSLLRPSDIPLKYMYHISLIQSSVGGLRFWFYFIRLLACLGWWVGWLPDLLCSPRDGQKGPSGNPGTARPPSGFIFSQICRSDVRTGWFLCSESPKPNVQGLAGWKAPEKTLLPVPWGAGSMWALAAVGWRSWLPCGPSAGPALGSLRLFPGPYVWALRGPGFCSVWRLHASPSGCISLLLARERSLASWD